MGASTETGGNNPAQPIVLDEEQWSDLMILTGGASSACFQCGVCTASCPWGLVKDETFSARALMRAAQIGVDDGLEDLWLCTACGQCESYCPRGVKISDVMRGLRHHAWQNRQTPAGLPTVLWSLHGNNNPWGQPPSARSRWAADLSIPYYDANEHEILLYVGCTAAYDRRVQGVARALVRLLRAAGVTFGFLADDEPCCGESALSLGHEPFFSELIGRATNSFRQHAVTRLVTISPHCYDAFKRHLAADLIDIELFHYPRFLARLVAEKRLSFDNQAVGRVTFHDPCYLARRHDDVTSARSVLEAVPGFDVAEMAHHGPDTLCCGGGGGRMWLETAPTERFANIRIGEATDVAAEFLITACPFCLSCLEDSRKAMKVKNLRVLDLAEAVLMALERQHSLEDGEQNG